MNSLPFSVSEDPFDKELWGSYGSFTTRESYELDYILTSIPIQKIEMISTATEAFDVSEINFDELIQRDIAQERVLKIANEYLEHGDERVIFFPPLLATLIVIQNDRIKDQYDSVGELKENEHCIWTLDEDKFQIQLPISNERTDMQVTCNDENYYVYQFGCKLRFNSDATKLVVLDGQHRLSALRHLQSNSEKRNVVKNLRIPVCIVYTPGATSDSTESIKKNLRELFVRINRTAKGVSGHFIRLLDDSSLTSMAAREVANQFKREYFDSHCALHLVEWNQRSDKRTHQTERAYSITTISIIADALESSVFNDYNRFSRILRLSEHAGNWPEGGRARGIDNIRDQDFSEAEGTLIKEQAQGLLAPQFFILFTEPKVYSGLVNKVNEAFRWLNDAVDSGRDGARHYKKILETEFRRADEDIDGEEAFSVGREFEQKISDYKKDELNEPFFLNVFQQGLIEVWAELSMHSSRYTSNLSAISKALVRALEALPIDTRKQYFSANRKYTQHTLYRNGRISFNKGNRDQWRNLLWTSFLSNDVRKEFSEALYEEIETDSLERLCEQVCYEIPKKAFFDLLDFYEAQELKTLKKNWEISGLPEEDIEKLSDAYQLSRQDSDDVTFDKLVEDLSRRSTKVAKERLENILQLPSIKRGE